MRQSLVKSIPKQFLKFIIPLTLFCLLAPMSLSIGAQFETSLQSLLIIALALIFEVRLSLLLLLSYFLLGGLGLPVFMDYSSGWEKFIGSTAGFLWSFPILVFIIGLYRKKLTKNWVTVFVTFIFAHVFILVVGYAYYAFFAEKELIGTVLQGLTEFCLPMLVKSLAGTGVVKITNWYRVVRY